MKNNNIPIFFAVDENYVPFLGVAIASLIENANKNYQYDIHIVHEPLKEESKQKLKKLETNYARIIFTEMKNKMEGITDKVGTRLRPDIFTLTIYFRIFLPFMFPEYDKGIYLDSDIVVLGDISELFNYNLENNLIGAIKDDSVRHIDIFGNYMEKAIGISRNDYINSGILLMNMKKLREVNFEEHFLYLLNKYNFDSVAPDQDYINAMCKDNILFLPSEWDAMPTDIHQKIDNPKLIHYNLLFKPWHYDNIDYEEYFWQYAKKSDFYNIIKIEKSKFNKQKQEEDHKNIELMLEKAALISTYKTTLRSIFEDGIESRL